MPGFRITLSLEGLTGSVSGKRKCLVFIDDKWSKVADLEAHMLKVFGVKHLEIFIDDCWVSSEEPICIIKPSDNITVKKVKFQNEAVEQSSPNASEADSREKKEKRHKKKRIDQPPAAVEPEIDDAAVLAAKKEELLSKVEAALGQEEMDVTDNPAESSKKRRHRKRPNQKRRERLERLSVGAALQSCFSQSTEATTPPAPAEEIPTGTSHSHHIRFDEEPVQDKSDACKVTTDAPTEDWQERLLALAQERNKPVFVRREAFVENGHSEPKTLQNGFKLTNGLNGTANGDGGKSLENGKCDYPDACQSSILHNSVPTDVAKTSDVLCFKKLNVLDGKPGVSDYLLALVEEVDEVGSLILKILEGEPEQAFSPDEIQDSEGGCFIVRVAWKHIIEPRLVVDTSLLSKYL